MGEELSESDLQGVKELEPQISKQQVSTENVESSESEEMKNDGLEKAAVQDEASSSVPSTESLVSEDLESTNSSSDEASDSKRNSTIVKGDYPASTTELEINAISPFDSGQETSDNQEMRPNAVSSRSLKMNRLRDMGKKFFEDAPNKIREMFNSVLPRKEYSTDSSGATSSFSGEGSSGEVQTLQSPLQMRTPLHVEVASQAGISGSETSTSGSSIEGTTTSENGSVFSSHKGGNLLYIPGSKVSNGKASKGEISNLKDDLSSPTKKAKLQIEKEAEGDESTDSSSSRE